MDLENILWDKAEQEFKHWKRQSKNKPGLLLSDILKSAFLHFRKKQAERINHLCQQAFEHHQEKENERLRRVHEETFDYSEIYFRLGRLTEDEKRERTLEENETIIQGIRSGDQLVFNRLYEYEFPGVVKLVLDNSGNIDSAKDIFQHGITILWEQARFNSLDLTCSISTYLYSICRILWLEQLRKNKRQAVIADVFTNAHEEITFPGLDDTPDVYESVSSAIQTLGDPCKQLLESFYYQNLSWDEIAGTLGYANAASARNQKYKCLERIRKLVTVEEER